MVPNMDVEELLGLTAAQLLLIVGFYGIFAGVAFSLGFMNILTLVTKIAFLLVILIVVVRHITRRMPNHKPN